MRTRVKAGICGHFGGGKIFSDGQTVKTILLTKQLKAIWGDGQVLTLDTYQWKKHVLKLFFQALRLMQRCEHILLLPSWNGVKVFIPLFLFLNKFYHRKLHYVIIGSWLPDLLRNTPALAEKVKRLDGLYGETASLVSELRELGLSQTYLFPNFKELDIVEDTSYEPTEPLRLCTFSRVLKQKGIPEAVAAVQAANEKLGRQAYTLDIWGDVHPVYEKEFEIFRTELPDGVVYRGCLSYADTTDTLRQYFALLFPTRFPREGIPGSILDSYAAGLPVLSSHFVNAPQIIEDGRTGLILDFDRITEALTETLCRAAEHPDELLSMRPACAEKAGFYQAKNIVKAFADQLSGKETVL